VNSSGACSPSPPSSVRAVASYGGIAKRIGAPGSVRAVAQALRHNPLPIVIPCHRVIGSTGDLTGMRAPGSASRSSC